MLVSMCLWRCALLLRFPSLAYSDAEASALRAISERRGICRGSHDRNVPGRSFSKTCERHHGSPLEKQSQSLHRSAMNQKIYGHIGS